MLGVVSRQYLGSICMKLGQATTLPIVVLVLWAYHKIAPSHYTRRQQLPSLVDALPFPPPSTRTFAALVPTAMSKPTDVLALREHAVVVEVVVGRAHVSALCHAAPRLTAQR